MSLLAAAVLVLIWPPGEHDPLELVEGVASAIGCGAAYCGLSYQRAARRALAVLNGPAHELYLTSRFEPGPRGSRVLRATLRRSPDHADVDIDLKRGLYQRPYRTTVENLPATVFGPLGPGSPIVILARGVGLVGSVRYSALDLDLVRDIACTAKPPNLERRIWSWAAASAAVLIPIAEFDQHHHGGLGVVVGAAIVLLLLWIRRRLAERRRAALGF